MRNISPTIITLSVDEFEGHLVEGEVGLDGGAVRHLQVHQRELGGGLEGDPHHDVWVIPSVGIHHELMHLHLRVLHYSYPTI